MEKYNHQMMGAITAGDAALVKSLLEGGAPVNEKNMLCEFEYNGKGMAVDETPLSLAFRCKQYEIAKLLADFGAVQSEDGGMYLAQAVCHKRPDVFAHFAASGAAVKRTKAGVEQILSCLAGDGCWDSAYIPVIERFRLPLKKYGGYGLYRAAGENLMEMARWLLSVGVDINARTSFNKETPLYAAAESGHLEMVKLLVESGADLALTDAYGVRPYIAAKQHWHFEVAAYIKGFEPEALHSGQAQEQLFAEYNVPSEMAEYLKNGERYLEFPDDEHIAWIRLCPYMDVWEMDWNNKKVLCFLEDCAEHGLYLVWEKKARKIYLVDEESPRMRRIGTWEEFIRNPVKCMNSVTWWAHPL